MFTCYIGLGSNLEQPRRQVVAALAELGSLAGSTVPAVSSLYRSKALGPRQQPDFINAVAQLVTGLPALTLLSELQAIEAAHRRVRRERWGPRTLDLDILLYGDEKITGNDLVVPHPEMKNRAFVLIPLYEIAPQLTIPGLGKLADLLAATDREGLVKIAADELELE